MFRLPLALAALCLVAAVWHPAGAMAHGVGSRELDPGAARAMVFLYADGEPMAFAQVQVTAPDGTVHQSARTDGKGGFAFLPSGSGVWRVAASDGQGHRAVREVAVGVASAPGSSGGAENVAGQPGQPELPRQSGSASPALAAQPAPGPAAVSAQATSPAGIGPNWRDVVLGLSLLANLALGAACLRRRGR
ncbi:MAG TPA: carboxypeptidase-like regulatory domain-containing protein [Solidesulfovibrio magneticus]|nr:carboxypeptidase-like regulatory domain-containing protein [Solidesulfovibrio magneticus]